MSSKKASARWVQGGLLALLVICAAQVAYWVVAETRFATSVRDATQGFWKRSIDAARLLQQKGTSADEIKSIFPWIDAGVEGALQLESQWSLDLEIERSSRINRYAWEGSFFLLVLFAAMYIVGRAIRQDLELRRRQQNFLAAVSHEFKSPLASLQLAAETLLARQFPRDKQETVLRRMLEDTARLQDMASNILDATSLEEGRIKLDVQDLALLQLVADVIRPLLEPAAERNVKVKLNIADDLAVCADEYALRTIMRNLIDNAIKATAAHGGGCVEVSAMTDDLSTQIIVEDDGMGFDPRESTALFQKFYRTGDEMQRRTPGSGLGLYIVARFCRLLGATVTSFSEGEGKGARFTLTWPRRSESS